MKIPALVLMVGILASCAHRKPQPEPASDPAAAVTATEQQMAKQAAELSAPPPTRGRTDCDRARTLRDNVCALGQRVCLLVDGEGNVPEGAARCKKANLQCQKASTHPKIKQCVRLVRR